MLDLLFILWLAGYNLPSANEATVYMAPKEAIDKIGQVLPRIIEEWTIPRL